MFPGARVTTGKPDLWQCMLYYLIVGGALLWIKKRKKTDDMKEDKIGKTAVKNYMEMQPGDVVRTYADTSDLEKAINFRPSTSIEEGLEKFANWYKEFYNIEIKEKESDEVTI